jgi:hypothetical protein
LAVLKWGLLLQWVAAALLACGCVSLAEFADWPAADDLVAKTSCIQSAAPSRCMRTRAGWSQTYANAIGGDYQSERAVALCLSTGCDDAIIENRILGCAWRHVIAGSRHAQSAEDDTTAIGHFCGSDYVDDTDRQTARDQSAVWLGLLGSGQRP